jgi:hypothetical protein
MSKINKINFKIFTTEADIKEARAALSKRLAEIKEGLPKEEEPVANAGAGKAVEEPVTLVKVTKSKKAAVKTVPEEKPAAKAVEAKNTDGKREIAFPATASHTKALKEGLNNRSQHSTTKHKKNTRHNKTKTYKLYFSL